MKRANYTQGLPREWQRRLNGEHASQDAGSASQGSQMVGPWQFHKQTTGGAPLDPHN